MKTVLVVAAEPLEVKWIPAERNGYRWVKITGGHGPRLVRAALDRCAERVDAVLSTGLCGGLDPALRVGDVVVARSVNGREINVPEARGPVKTGPLVSIDRIVGSAEEKRALFGGGAIAVEMEAAAVLEWAEQRRLPFFCVRAVSDAADQSFALDMNAARDDDGRLRHARIVLAALRHPGAGIPELFRLWRNAGRAAKALGEFIGKCTF